jgi:hypothetical protein
MEGLLWCVGRLESRSTAAALGGQQLPCYSMRKRVVQVRLKKNCSWKDGGDHVPGFHSDDCSASTVFFTSHHVLHKAFMKEGAIMSDHSITSL